MERIFDIYTARRIAQITVACLCANKKRDFVKREWWRWSKTRPVCGGMVNADCTIEVG